MSVIENVMSTALHLKPDAKRDTSQDRLRVVGTPLSRVDGALKVTGKARFAAEVPFENLTYAALSYSSIARGRIASIDTTAAEAAPGVLLVMTYKNAPRLKAPLLIMANPKGGAASKLPVMQDDSIHWNGEPVAIVIAATQEQADHAATLIRTTYTQEQATISFDAAKSQAKLPEKILRQPTTISIGEAEAALAAAEFSVDRTFRTARHNHAAMELHAVTVHWEGDELTVHDMTQMLQLTRATFAEVFELPEENVRILSPFVGGAFGGKLVWNHHILAAAAARRVGRPVRMVLSREGVFRATGGRTLTEQRVALGGNASGKLSALIHTGVAGVTSHNLCPEQFTFPARLLYAADSFLISQKTIDLDTVANIYMRAPGESVGTFALECAVDELAEKMGRDPVELRRLIEPEKNPTSGLPFSARNLNEAYRRGAERFGWSKRNSVPRSQRDGEWLIGQGVATATYPYYRVAGGAASIRLTSDGCAIVQMASHEMGMGTATVQAQYAADLLGLPVEQVSFEYGDASMPNGTYAGGSSQSASIIAAVKAASEVLAKELLGLAGKESSLAGLNAQDVELHDGALRRRNDASRRESYVSILKRAGRNEITCQAEAPPPAEIEKFSMHSYGAQFCEVRVNEITGETRVTRWLGSFDTGRILNPKTAASQFRGGIIMGIGLALTEEVLFDERMGRIMNPSLAEYHVPVHLDVPEIDVIWTDIPDPQSPHGVRGIGEIGITGVAAAIANAIYNATGIRNYEVPITLDKLMEHPSRRV